jgi:hypothetical protein
MGPQLTGVRPPVGVADGPGATTLDPVVTARRHGIDEGELLLGWYMDAQAWIDELGAWPAPLPAARSSTGP